MLKTNKLKVILSSLMILLPILLGVLLWEDLPDQITTHWGADGSGDGLSGKAFAVFGLPCLLLALHLVCLLVTMLDKKQRDQSPKALNMIFWILPTISLLTNGVMYRAAFGKEVDVMVLVPILLGFLFVFMGNYLPKTKQNSTLGIKLFWTLNNEENWNKTHRLGGKVWFVGGLLLLFSVFLPLKAMMWIILLVISAAVLIPFSYSYWIYKQHRKAGIVYAAAPKSKTEKIAAKVAAVIVTVLLVGVAIVMFTGNIEVKWEDTAFQIQASYWTDLKVDYTQIDEVEYRKDLDVGVRTNGLQSARLLLGIFQNEEFGPYTLYAYTGAKEFVVLTSGEKILVIGLGDAKDTQAIYDTLISKTGQ